MQQSEFTYVSLDEFTQKQKQNHIMPEELE